MIADIQENQKMSLLALITEDELKKIAAKNSLPQDVPKAQLISNLCLLANSKLLKSIQKQHLKLYISKNNIQEQFYVAAMRDSILEFWENERIALIAGKSDNTKKSLKKQDDVEIVSLGSNKSGKTEKSQSPKTQVHRDVEIVSFDSKSSSNVYSDCEIVSQSQNHQQIQSHQQQQIQNRSGSSFSLIPTFSAKNSTSKTFCSVFYGRLYDNVGSMDELWSTGSTVYIFLFSPEGDTLVAEQKIEGLNNIMSFMPLLRQYCFVPGSASDETDEYGTLKIISKGNIVAPNGNCVGLFTHFFELFKPNGNASYLIREASFHMKTHQSYQPLKKCIPYKELLNYQ